MTPGGVKGHVGSGKADVCERVGEEISVICATLETQRAKAHRSRTNLCG